MRRCRGPNPEGKLFVVHRFMEERAFLCNSDSGADDRFRREGVTLLGLKSKQIARQIEGAG
jgi:hypothetical protein